MIDVINFIVMPYMYVYVLIESYILSVKLKDVA